MKRIILPSASVRDYEKTRNLKIHQKKYKVRKKLSEEQKAKVSFSCLDESLAMIIIRLLLNEFYFLKKRILDEQNLE